MNVFLSWSGDASRAVAEALVEWLPDVMQAIKPFMSENIPKGEAGLEEIRNNIALAEFGVICVAGGNQDSTWLNYEAGGLASRFQEQRFRRVSPYLLDISPGKLKFPLGSLQATVAYRDDTLKMLKSINEMRQDEPMQLSRLEKSFDIHWPTLEPLLDAARKVSPETDAAPPRELEDMMEEVLEIVRTERLNPSFGRGFATGPMATGYATGPTGPGYPTGPTGSVYGSGGSGYGPVSGIFSSSPDVDPLPPFPASDLGKVLPSGRVVDWTMMSTNARAHALDELLASTPPGWVVDSRILESGASGKRVVEVTVSVEAPDLFNGVGSAASRLGFELIFKVDPSSLTEPGESPDPA
jgi:hypothetical protein